MEKNIYIKHRKELLKEGFPASTVTAYAKGYRTPSYETASKIAAICGVSIMSIPWRKLEVNRP